MKFSKFILVILITTIVCDNKKFTGDVYRNLSAAEKMDQLWSEIMKDNKPAEWYSTFELLELFSEDQWKSFDTMGDVLPDKRKKLIHSVGAIAKAEWVSVGEHPYSGMFNSGNENVLVRLSVAKKLDISKRDAKAGMNNFAPGMGIKFLIDGEYSANTVAMFSTSGQESWNFFKNDFTPQFDVSDHESVAEKALARKFVSVTYWVSSVANSELASFTNTGKVSGHIKYPFKLVFKPNEKLRNGFPDNYEEDYITQIKKVPLGTVLYDVYAIEEPGCDEHKIGELRTTSDFVTSLFADRTLFFRHPLGEEDFKGHDDWKDYRDQYGILGRYPGKRAYPRSCPFANLFSS